MEIYDPELLIGEMGLRRFLYFNGLASGDLQLVWQLYQRDCDLREALRTELEVLEQVLRNRYHAIIQVLRPGKPSWLLDPALPVHRILPRRHKELYHRLLRQQITPGEVIERVSFGFWEQLTSVNLEASMWKTYLRHVYPAGTDRETVFLRVQAARLLRNRAAHLDYVLDEPLQQQWDNILWLLDRLHPHIAEKRRQVSGLPGLLS